jgi:carboxymethylenebutenolidase
MSPLSHFVIDTKDGPMAAVSSAPEDEPRGAVVVFQEAFGLTTHIEGITGRLAEAGWLAVAPALFHRQGAPVFAYDDYAALLPVMEQLDAAGLRTDIEATLEHLSTSGFAERAISVVGFCMGGAVALYAATLRPIGAAVTFYGGGVGKGRFGLPSLIDLAPGLQAPWLGLYGDLDKGIPVEDVERLREAATGAPVETEVVRYADADHGFNCNDRPAAFNPAAAADAWGRTLAWFDRHLDA